MHAGVEFEQLRGLRFHVALAAQEHLEHAAQVLDELRRALEQRFADFRLEISVVARGGGRWQTGARSRPRRRRQVPAAPWLPACRT